MVAFVPFDVPLQLRKPEIEPGFRQARQLAGRVWVPVPHASIDEYGDTAARKDNIWLSGQVGYMQPKPQPGGMHRPTYAEFWLCVPPLDPRHALGAFGWRQGISQFLMTSCWNS
jgi:hypothetical protein